MEAIKNKAARDTPERLIGSLVKKLDRHAFWDAFLLFLPPLAAVSYCLFYLFLKAWIGSAMAAGLGLATLLLGALGVIIRYHPNIPTARAAARLIDDRAAAQDRFLTIATLPPSKAAAPLISRLREEAAGLQTRFAIKREFPYRIKRHIYGSFLISLAAALLFQLLLPLAYSRLRPPSGLEQLRELAERMTERPGLKDAGRSLQDLAAKLLDPKMTPQDKQTSVQEERKKIEQQAKTETQKQDRDLLNQAAGTLQGLEQQTGGGEKKQEEEDGAGGIQSNLPQRGKKEGTQSQGNGDTKGEMSAQLNREMQQGKMTQKDAKEQGQQKNSGGNNAGTGNRAEENKPGTEPSKDRSAKTEGDKDNHTGRNKASEEIPQSAPPPDRLRKPGEGEYQGLKGAGYVTVQLPEEFAADGKGSGQEQSKSGKSQRAQIPVSNVPLPKHVPGAPDEKQQMPLEYRDIIR